MSRKSNQGTSLLDICVLTAGRVDLFNKCIDIILPVMKPEYSLYVFNNGSPSPEYTEAYKKIPDAKIKQTNQNIGYPAGANTVIRMGNSPLALFVSDDIYLDSTTIDTLLMRMDDPSIGICGLKLIFPKDSTDPNRPAGKVQHVGHAINIGAQIVHPLIGWSPENPKCCVSRDVISVTGACFIIRRKIYQLAGGFNESYGKGYFEDVDLCMTIKKLGHRVFIDTDATATHGVAETFKVRKDDPPPDLRHNYGIFQSRWGKYLQWTDYQFM
jgi:GT2 family glycosyltransferase